MMQPRDTYISPDTAGNSINTQIYEYTYAHKSNYYSAHLYQNAGRAPTNKSATQQYIPADISLLRSPLLRDKTMTQQISSTDLNEAASHNTAYILFYY